MLTDKKLIDLYECFCGLQDGDCEQCENFNCRCTGRGRTDGLVFESIPAITGKKHYLPTSSSKDTLKKSAREINTDNVGSETPCS